jgi:uncharacterized repeat protein (TIGR01451 family)
MNKILLLILIIFSFSLVYSQNEKAFFYTPDTTFLPDGGGVSYTSSINIYGYGAGQTINSINEIIGICINMEHSYLGDIVIDITCPNSTTIILENQAGGSTYLGEPIDIDSPLQPGIGWVYCFSPNPTYGEMGIEVNNGTIITNNSLPPGTYTSSEDLSGLIGCPINGEWTISVTDNWFVDDGFIFNWGIDFLNEPNCFTLLTGRIFADINENNVFDASDMVMNNMPVEATPGPYYGVTDNNGIYRIWVDSGDYSILQTSLDPIWEQNYPTNPLNHSASVLTNDYDTILNLDFANIANVYCPQMSVDIVLGQLGICETTTAMVSYSNNGTINSANSYITVELDENFTYNSGGNLISQVGNLLTFNIGDVGIMESGQFSFSFDYSCDPTLAGVTACTEAHIYPDSSCFVADTSWDHSSVMVEGFCNGDSLVCFTISNTGDFGDGDMQTNSEYRIYEDNMLVFTGTFQLNGSENIEICWTANGNTIRLEADQHPAHPGNSHPQESIELCGNPNNTMGQILVVPQDDYDSFVEIECQEVLSSFDPNDKQVTPQGLFSEHFIDASYNLEYKIRFQNTGTATANKVVVIDTISNFLDMSTFTTLSSSHSYYIEILGSNIVKWTFENIMLPDSGANQAGSNGYIKFKINQNAGNTEGSVINNSAAIYFDYNFPVITNKVFNTIGNITNITGKKIVYSKSNQNIKIYPNPTTGIINIKAENIKRVEILDMNGKIIYSDKKNIIDLSKKVKGIYFIKITTQKEVVVKKIILE